MSSILKKVLPFQQQQQEMVPHLYQYKNRFALLGTVGSGKTSICAAIVLTAQTLSSTQPNFRCRILEGSSGVRVAVSNLRRGKFPPKTPVDMPSAPEAGLLLSWGGMLGEKRVQIPICDISGEDVHRMIEKYGTEMYPTKDTYSQLTNLIRYVQDSDGFVLAVPASRALLFDDDTKLEKEPSDIAVDPDVNLARILDSVFEHKQRSGGKKIKGIAVVITKWDLVDSYARSRRMDIYDPTGQGLQAFMDVCFPDTMMSLKAYGMQNVRFFPSYFQAKRESDGSLSRWEDDKSPIIQAHDTIPRMPKYAEESYFHLFDYLKAFAT